MPGYEIRLENKSLATVVRRAREEINYTIEDLAETSGLAEDEIMEIETGLCCDREKLHLIAAALHVPAELFAI